MNEPGRREPSRPENRPPVDPLATIWGPLSMLAMLLAVVGIALTVRYGADVIRFFLG